jgi:hypothetical protein
LCISQRHSGEAFRARIGARAFGTAGDVEALIDAEDSVHDYCLDFEEDVEDVKGSFG